MSEGERSAEGEGLTFIITKTPGTRIRCGRRRSRVVGDVNPVECDVASVVESKTRFGVWRVNKYDWSIEEASTRLFAAAKN